MSRGVGGLSTITAKRQLTLPVAVVRQLELHPGDKLELIINERGSILAFPMTQKGHRRILLLREIRRRVRQGISDEDLVRLIEQFVAISDVESEDSPSL
jgi:bifunctional DNA-binding transcriptional regulator/antitoxin component of YhaV-PrlF toxin-antitoxin module